MQHIIKAENLSKSYGSFKALDSINFEFQKGQIIGLIGPNGAGKTTLLKSISGLSHYEGNLDVLGLKPLYNRHKLMERMCFIADVAILPKWITAEQAIEFVSGVHPKFDREKAKNYLSKTDIKLKAKVKELSKGMIVQLHLALVMAIDVELLVLDEPTLGLDIIYRKRFYQSLLNDYFTKERSIIITTHQIEEVEDLLSYIMMINKGKILIDSSMDELKNQFKAVKALENNQDLLNLKPIFTQKKFNEVEYIYQNIDSETLKAFGEVYNPSVSDIFQAKILGEGEKTNV